MTPSAFAAAPPLDLRPDLPRAAHIVRVEEENYRTRTFVLDLDLDARPGQFIMAWLPGIEERPFSLISGHPVSITVARVGPFTTALHQLGPGDRLWVRGPYGNGFQVRGEHLLCVAGGYGVAPMLFVARQALAEGRKVTAIIGARTAQDLLFTSKFEALGCPVVVTTDDGSAGLRGLVTEGVRSVLAREPVSELYACGPRPMLQALLALCQDVGLPCQLSWENKMRCGMGICGTCEEDGWLVCSEGPVRAWSPGALDKSGA